MRTSLSLDPELARELKHAQSVTREKQGNILRLAIRVGLPLILNRYQAPRLHKQMEFTRRSFGPGDEVTALCKVTRIEGGTAVHLQRVPAQHGKRHVSR